MYIRNAWYVAAFPREVGERPLARTLLDEAVVLWRLPDGRPIALEDRCCHRSLPLSMGRVVGDRLQCGYHGLEFDAAGTCVRVPGQATIPPGARVRAFPCVERWGFIWFWPGDPDDADPALIPNWWWATHPDWAINPGPVLYVRCNYQLITDNLQDLSHLAYVHTRTIGTGAIVDFPVKTEREDGLVRSTRWTVDSPAPPLFATASGYGDRPVDRWQIVETTPPCHTLIHAGCALAGVADRCGPPDGAGIHIKVLNAPTPETSGASHYFYAHCWNFRQHDADLKTLMFDEFKKTFEEDVDLLAAQQAMLDRAPGATQIDINVDAPGLACRRMVAAAIAAEADAAPRRA
ncbi:MAG: aromatic ring-hydroxylating dioxygenase subunit alpha [Alphaproteobacteria bacterium]|nr:aromatic ring-hydroxylating dioxygenase subunit alpha [Alphaproteobacteria bacterium]